VRDAADCSLAGEGGEAVEAAGEVTGKGLQRFDGPGTASR
jgi:hypothetical protein